MKSEKYSLPKQKLSQTAKTNDDFFQKAQHASIPCVIEGKTMHGSRTQKNAFFEVSMECRYFSSQLE